MWEVFEKLLERDGVSIADVSKATGISASVFSNWKKRRGKISAGNAEKIANFFGVTVGFLQGVQEDVQSKEYFDNVATALEAQNMFEDKRIRGLNHIRKNMDQMKFDAYYQMLVNLYKMENPQDDYDFGE